MFSHLKEVEHSLGKPLLLEEFGKKVLFPVFAAELHLSKHGGHSHLKELEQLLDKPLLEEISTKVRCCFRVVGCTSELHFSKKGWAQPLEGVKQLLGKPLLEGVGTVLPCTHYCFLWKIVDSKVDSHLKEVEKSLGKPLLLLYDFGQKVHLQHFCRASFDIGLATSCDLINREPHDRSLVWSISDTLICRCNG